MIQVLYHFIRRCVTNVVVDTKTLNDPNIKTSGDV